VLTGSAPLLIAVSAIGLFGGTFDPIHFAHLRLAEEIADAFNLEQVRLIPAAVPPHRDQPEASPEHRLAMTRLAIEGNPGLCVDARELDRTGVSYTVDTLTETRAESASQPLCLMMGADAFVALTTWRQWQDLFDLAHVIVARRPGFPLEQLASSLPAALHEEYSRRLEPNPAALETSAAGKIFTHELTALDVSATALRELVRRGASLRYLLPDPVIAYIEAHHLYREQDAS
jgi:nicotinate-nucleotide adenylyltransferase